jgi:hypothetical protein
MPTLSKTIQMTRSKFAIAVPRADFLPVRVSFANGFGRLRHSSTNAEAAPEA